jgi:hypothetical protein
MRMFAVLAALLVGGGLVIAMYWSRSFSVGAWYTGDASVFVGLGEPLRNKVSRQAPNMSLQRLAAAAGLQRLRLLLIPLISQP